MPVGARRTAGRAAGGRLLLATAVALALALVAPLRVAAETTSAHDIVAGWKGEHALLGTILRTRDGALFRPVQGGGASAEAALLDWLESAAAPFILLGEVHDNAGHHRFRAALIDALARRGGNRSARPALVFEQIRADKQAVLRDFAASGGGSAEALMTRLEWEKSGWPAAALFKPLFVAALARGLSITAGDVPRARMREIVRSGAAILPAEERTALHLDTPLAKPLRDALLDELEEGHCKLVARERLTGMVLAQRLRDAHLARALVAARQGGAQAILLAGNGHIRRDRAVPWYLARMQPDARIVIVQLAEVASGRSEASDYVPRQPDGSPAVDFVVFTPRTTRPDPCVALREHFKRRR